MNQDRYHDPGPDPGMYGSDRELFKRVWRRVMPEERKDCPIELAAERQPPFSPSQEHACRLPVPRTDIQDENHPAARPQHCLGEASSACEERLQSFLCEEVRDWKVCLALAGMAPPAASQALGRIAADKRGRAKRLSAAYFLISGVRFRPDRPPVPHLDNYAGMLRRQFFREQQAQEAYLTAGGQACDPCLREMYLELARGNAEHGAQIRGILEMLM